MKARCAGAKMALDKRSEGFVLVTVLVLLALLTMLGVGMFMSSIATQQDSAAAARAAQARYYAETAIEYMRWAWANDAELDFPAIPHASEDSKLGDRAEWQLAPTNPGPTTIGGTGGQVMYFDNSAKANRFLFWDSLVKPSPTMRRISVHLPTYVRVDIDAKGNIKGKIKTTPRKAAKAFPHHGAVPKVDVPETGAILWLTGGTRAADCVVSAANDCGKHIIAYAVGYVDGKPLSLIRAQIR